MGRTPEQKAADENLLAAIQRSISVDARWAENQVLVDFVVVTESQQLGEDGEMRETWNLLLKDGEDRTTAVVGLLMKGSDIMRGIGHHQRAGDE